MGQLKLCDFGFARQLPSNNGSITDYVSTRFVDVHCKRTSIASRAAMLSRCHVILSNGVQCFEVCVSLTVAQDCVPYKCLARLCVMNMHRPAQLLL